MVRQAIYAQKQAERGAGAASDKVCGHHTCSLNPQNLTECMVSSATTIAQTAGDEKRGGELDGEV